MSAQSSEVDALKARIEHLERKLAEAESIDDLRGLGTGICPECGSEVQSNREPDSSSTRTLERS